MKNMGLGSCTGGRFWSGYSEVCIVFLHVDLEQRSLANRSEC